MNQLVILTVVAFIACAYGQAAQYPAGLNPALCPGYPNCDNALLALYSTGAILAPPLQAPAARYPAGVPAAACPNYPYCNVGAPESALPLPGFTQRLYPAGVPAAACPNYPLC